MIAKESISIVIPAYNETETVAEVAGEALRELKKLTPDYELVLVDDGSTDGTGEIIDDLAKRDRYVRTVHHKVNRGFTGAMKTSFKNAKKSLVFLAPADGQFDFNELNKFVKAIPGYDAAIGYRVGNVESFIRKLNSRFFHFLCRNLFGIHLREISTVSLWRRRVANSIKIISDDRSALFLPEIISKAMRKNCRFIEVPIHWGERRGGEPKGANPKIIVKTLIQMLKLWYITVTAL